MTHTNPGVVTAYGNEGSFENEDPNCSVADGSLSVGKGNPMVNVYYPPGFPVSVSALAQDQVTVGTSQTTAVIGMKPSVQNDGKELDLSGSYPYLAPALVFIQLIPIVIVVSLALFFLRKKT